MNRQKMNIVKQKWNIVSLCPVRATPLSKVNGDHLHTANHLRLFAQNTMSSIIPRNENVMNLQHNGEDSPQSNEAEAGVVE
jgi:hypothetical protein